MISINTSMTSGPLFKVSSKAISKRKTTKQQKASKKQLRRQEAKLNPILLKAMDDLRGAGCELLTLGQYLAPSPQHYPVVRYVPPEKFEEYETEALDRGFLGVASAPLVRSSYNAEQLYLYARARDKTESDLK